MARLSPTSSEKAAAAQVAVHKAQEKLDKARADEEKKRDDKAAKERSKREADEKRQRQDAERASRRAAQEQTAAERARHAREAARDAHVATIEAELAEARATLDSRPWEDVPEKITVLFMTAEPDGPERLHIDREIREIQEQVRSSKLRDSIAFEYPPRGAGHRPASAPQRGRARRGALLRPRCGRRHRAA